MNRRLLPKAYAALVCYMALAPLYLLPGAVLLPDMLWLSMLLPVPAILLTGLAGLCPAKRRNAALLLAMALMAAGCLFLFLSVKPLGMLLYLPCAFTMLAFIPAVNRPAHQEFTMRQMVSGIVLHIIAQILKGIGVFSAAGAPLSWIFVAYLIACLFSFNRNMLADTGSSAIKTLLRKNRKLLAVFCVLALLLANIQAVIDAIRAAIQWIIVAVANVVAWLFSFVKPSETGAQTPGDMGSMFAMEEAAEQSLFSRIMEIVLIVIAVLAAIAVLYLFCKHLVKLLRKAFAALMERVRVFRQRIAADYDDQSESLMDWGEIKKTAAARIGRVKRRIFPTRWEKLSPAQTVRRVYQLLLRKAEEPDPARTAREMLTSGKLRLPENAAAPAADLYDRARYSSHPISQQEADDLRRSAGV